MRLNYLLTLSALLLIFQFSTAQEKLNISNSSKMLIHGTSTLHDWTSEVTDLKGSAEITKDGQLKDINKLNFKVRVESIESGKSKMDKYTYEALKSENHPYISFSLNDVKSISGSKIIATGYVTIGGTKKNTQVSGTYSMSGGKLTIKGNKDIDMTKFNIEPPTAMFGTIVVGEKVNIEYNLILN